MDFPEHKIQSVSHGSALHLTGHLDQAKFSSGIGVTCQKLALRLSSHHILLCGSSRFGARAELTNGMSPKIKCMSLVDGSENEGFVR